MRKSIYTKQSKLLSEKIVNWRNEAGLTQRGLAKKLNREHSLVARIELGERRVDIVEFYWLCKACGVPPEKMAAEMMKTFAGLDISS